MKTYTIYFTCRNHPACLKVQEDLCIDHNAKVQATDEELFEMIKTISFTHHCTVGLVCNSVTSDDDSEYVLLIDEPHKFFQQR